MGWRALHSDEQPGVVATSGEVLRQGWNPIGPAPGAIEVFRQDSEPITSKTGDFWINETPEENWVAGFQSGDGPPDELLVLPEGSTYLDLLTGDLYKDI